MPMPQSSGSTSGRPLPGAPPAGLLERSGLENLPARCRPARLLLLAADGREELAAALAAARERIAAGGELPPPPRRAGAHRLALVARDAADLAARAEAAAAKLAQAGSRRRLTIVGSFSYGAAGPGEPRGKTTFLFPGQGSQHPGMLDELCLALPRVRDWFEELDRMAVGLPIPAPSLLAFPPAAGLTEEERAFLGSELFDMRGGAQLGVVANMALHEVVVDLGVSCDMIVGHSNGEHAALFAANVFHAGRRGLFDAIRRMLERAIAMPLPPVPEAVVTVGLRDRGLLDREVAAEAEALHLAMVNCPSQFVLAGLAEAVERAGRRLSEAGGIVLRTPFRHAYHTPLFAPWGDWLRRLYDESGVGPGDVPLYSCLTAARYPEGPEAIRDLAAAQWSHPVDFEATVERLYEDGARRFVEIGPESKLKGFLGDTLRQREHVAVATSSARYPALEQLLRAVGELFVQGVEIDFASASWRALARLGAVGKPEGFGDVGVGAPAAPRGERPAAAAAASAAGGPRREIVHGHFALMQEFLAGQARVLAMVAAAPASPPAAATPAEWPLLGSDVRCDGRLLEAERRFDLERDPLLRDHSLGPAAPPPAPPPLAVLPFTFSLEIAAEAAVRLFGGGVAAGMSAVRASRWLALDRGALALRITAEAQGPGLARVRLFQLEAGRPALAFEADVQVAAGFPAAPPPRPAAPGLAPPRLWSAVDFYRDYAFHGPAFQGLHRVASVGAGAITAELEVLPRPAPRGAAVPPAFLLDPALLDCAGQLVGFWLLEGGRRDFGIFPFHLRELRVYGPAPPPGAAIGGRAAVTWQDRGTTEAAVDLFAAGGSLIYRLAGFEQRYLALPPHFARAFLGSGQRERTLTDAVPSGEALIARAIDLPHRFLEESWGIWSRALAHQALAQAELDEWYDGRRRSIPWLLGRVAGKEAVAAWAAEARGLAPAAAEVTLEGDELGLQEIRCPALAAPLPLLRLGRDGERLVARILADG